MCLLMAHCIQFLLTPLLYLLPLFLSLVPLLVLPVRHNRFKVYFKCVESEDGWTPENAARFLKKYYIKLLNQAAIFYDITKYLQI